MHGTYHMGLSARRRIALVQRARCECPASVVCAAISPYSPPSSTVSRKTSKEHAFVASCTSVASARADPYGACFSLHFRAWHPLKIIRASYSQPLNDRKRSLPMPPLPFRHPPARSTTRSVRHPHSPMHLLPPPRFPLLVRLRLL